MTNTIHFHKYRIILLQFIPNECIDIIEKYHTSLYFYPSLQIINTHILLGNRYFYNDPVRYLRQVIHPTRSEQEVKYQIESICRYIMYNYEFFQYESPLYIRRIQTAIKGMLTYNASCWDMCNYYYKILFFTELI